MRFHNDLKLQGYHGIPLPCLSFVVPLPRHLELGGGGGGSGLSSDAAASAPRIAAAAAAAAAAVLVHFLPTAPILIMVMTISMVIIVSLHRSSVAIPCT